MKYVHLSQCTANVRYGQPKSSVSIIHKLFIKLYVLAESVGQHNILQPGNAIEHLLGHIDEMIT